MENPLKVSLENIIPLTEARDHFSQIVNEVQKDKLYVLTKGGKPAVAIIDVKYLEHITGGEAKMENIEEEIKKAPEKVGLPPMVEHLAPKSSTPPSTPPPPPPKVEPPKPAGFAAPQPPTSPTTIPPTPPTSPPPSPASAIPPPPAPANPQTAAAPPLPENQAQTSLKTPVVGGQKIDVQFSQNNPENTVPKEKNNPSSPEDKNSPAQYAGDSDKEPEDMALD